MEVEFEWGEESLLYEAVVEEIALEGLDGITLQALLERLVDRENGPISKNEAGNVQQSIWNALKKDVRLRFHLLPENRPLLHIWNRYLHYDARDNVEEPFDAPNEIYTYKCIEARLFEAPEARERMEKELANGRRVPLSKGQVRRIQIPPAEGPFESGEIELEGIWFDDSVHAEEEDEKKKDKKKTAVDEVEEEEDVGVFGVRGSCADFTTRVDVTEGIRKTNLSYSKSVTTLGHRLVIVANQFLRESLLFQNANQVEVSGLQYCVVERVGRARHYGEQARGKISLTAMGVDAKTLFYHRKVLLSEGIISKQPLVMRFADSKTAPTLISVFHLPHFFRRQDSPESVKIRKIFAYIFNAPNYIVDFFKLQGIFGKYLMRTLNDEYKEFVRLEMVPYASVYPAEVEAEKKAARKEFLLKRQLRVITLRNPELSLREIIEKQLVKQEPMDEDEDPVNPPKQEEVGDEEDETFDWTYCYAPEKELAHELETTQMLRFMISRGYQGVVQQDLSEEMSMTALDSRSVVRYLTRWKIATSQMEDHGKTKITRWRYFKCKKPIEEVKEIELEIPESPPKELVEIKILGPDDETGEGIFPIDEEFLLKNNKKSKTGFTWKSRKKLTVPVVEPSQEIIIHEILPPPPTQPEEPPLHVKKKPVKRKLTHNENLPPPLVKKKRSREIILDFADLEAQSIRERQRADWNPEEDREVLYSFIASVLFIPRYNLDRVFVYNATQIRDILHERCPEMKTKTSGVMRRRLHAMLKNQNLYSRYRTMLDIALRDEELYSTLIEPHLPPPSIAVFHRVPNSAIDAVMNYLLAKFGTTEQQKEHVPGRLDDLEALIDARELRRMETVWVDVWANVFHKFYKKREKTGSVSNPVQEDAVSELENEGLVIDDPPWILPPNRIRTPSPQPQDPIIYNDDQLDAVFEAATALVSTADRIITEEPPSSSSSEEEGEGMIVPLPAFTNKVLRNITLKQKGTGGFVPELYSCERNANSSTEVFSWTCRTVFMSVLLGGGGNQKSLKAFMESIPDNLLDRVVNSLRSLMVFMMLKPSRRLVLTNNMKRKLTNYLHPTAFRITQSIHTSLQEESAPISFLRYNHMGAGYLLAEIAPLINIQISLPTSIITVREEWRQDYESLLASQSQVPSGQGREELVLRLLRLRLNAGNEKGKLVEQDFFDINLPQIDLELNDEIPLPYLIHGEALSRSEKDILQSKLLQFLEWDPLNHFLGPKDLLLGSYEGLYQLIDVTGHVGVSVTFLLTHCSNREELREGLMYLMGCGYVFMVGIRHRKFVAAKNMEKWTTLISSGQESRGKQRVVMRPWVNAHGDVNWKLIDRAIVGMLGQIQRNPQTFVGQIARSLSPLFSHVEILILVSLLVDLQLVDVFKLCARPQQNFSLFSKWTDIEEDEEGHDLEAPMKDYKLDPVLDLEQAWIELMPFHLSKYARIQALILPQQVHREHLEDGDEDDDEEEEEDEEDFPHFDPEDVEIMVGQDDEDVGQEDEGEEEDE